MSKFDDFRRDVVKMGRPVTVSIIALSAIGFLLVWFARESAILPLIFAPAHFLRAPWSILTYPFVSGDFIGVLFQCLWVFWVGSTLETALGSKNFTIFWLVSSVLGAICAAAGAVLLGIPGSLAGGLIPIGALTVAWATRYPNSTVMLAMIIPVRAMWLGWISAGLVLFNLGRPVPLFGAICLIPLGLAYIYAANRIPWLAFGPQARPTRAAWTPRERDDRYFDEVAKRKKDREERERLRKLFERSLIDDPEDRANG